MSAADYNAMSNQAYREMQDATGEGNQPALEIISEWYEEHEKEKRGEPRSSRSVVACMKAARQNFTTLVSSIIWWLRNSLKCATAGSVLQEL